MTRRQPWRTCGMKPQVRAIFDKKYKVMSFPCDDEKAAMEDTSRKVRGFKMARKYLSCELSLRREAGSHEGNVAQGEEL